MTRTDEIIVHIWMFGMLYVCGIISQYYSVQSRSITKLMYQRFKTNFILYLCSVYIKLLNANISELRKQRMKDFTENIGGYPDQHHHGRMYLKNHE